MKHFALIFQLFGYIQSSAEEMEDIMVGEEVSIFTVSKRRRVGEAAGMITSILNTLNIQTLQWCCHDDQA